MEVRTLSTNDLSQLQNFNNTIFPNKLIATSDYLAFWFDRKGHPIEQCLILKEEDGTIHGQILASEMAYYYKQERINTVWLFDLIVDENLRKSGWGVDLLLACMDKHPRSCSTGSGPTALPIHLKMGNKMLGEIRKYVGIVNPFGLFSSFYRGNICAEKFPKSVKAGGRTYKKLSLKELPFLTNPFNESLLEISRDNAFLGWRYFNELHSYALYKEESSDDFFVVRTTILKHVTVMLLVDYRCDMSNTQSFECIYSAVKKIMQKVHVGIMITGSSLDIVDRVLENHKCKSVGRPRPVIGFVNVKERKKDIEERNFLFATLADSDGETNWV